ncbi:MAG: hypothetical protein JKY08_07430 [Flavobacteriaceae bacterium]|nr:hypothetical protein [Flavobacteriaceae bacterium]
MFVFLFLKSQDTTSLNEDLCPTDGEISRVLVLFDTSDGLGLVTSLDIKKRLIELSNNVEIHSRFEFSTLNPSYPIRNVLFNACNAPKGEEVDSTIENPKLAQKKWEEGFFEPLNKLFLNLPETQANQSPIMAGIQDIALNYLGTSDSSSVRTEIIIISDMIEHTDSYSQYHGNLSFNRYVDSKGYKKFATNLNGADVYIWLVIRENSTINTLKHMNFWTEWIRDNRGQLKKVNKLQGVN